MTTLKELAEVYGYPVDKLGELLIQDFDASVEYVEKIKSRQSKLTGWVEKYPRTQTITFSITITKKLKPQFYEEDGE